MSQSGSRRARGGSGRGGGAAADEDTQMTSQNEDESLPLSVNGVPPEALAELGGADDAFSEAEEADVDDEDQMLEDELEGDDEARRRRQGNQQVDPDGDEEDEGDEDLFGPSAELDYVGRPELDRYDPEMLDDSEVGATSQQARRRAEREMEDRDRAARREGRAEGTSRQAARYYGGLEELLAEDEEEEHERRQIRRRQRERLEDVAANAARPLPRQADQARDELPHCDSKTEWTERIEEIIKVILQGFIWHFRRSPDDPQVQGEVAMDSQTDVDGRGLSSDLGLCIDKISELVKEEATSLLVAWQDLMTYSPKLCDWLTLFPTAVIGLFDTAISETTQTLFPSLYANVKIHIRLSGFMSFSSLRNLRTDCLNQLVAVEGVCIRRTNVFPQLKLYYLECVKCGCDMNGPYEKRDDDFYATRNARRKCQDCQSNGPFITSRESTIYENFQRLTIQEPPGNVKPGHVPRQRKVSLYGDLVDTVRPGDDIVVTGIYQTLPTVSLNAKSGFPIFETQIVANNIQRKGDIKIQELTDQDIDIIKRLARNKTIREKIIDSIAPSIWGHRHVKTAVAYAMFGAVRRQTSSKHAIRGDINVLLLGDPGTAKSQFLKYVEKTFERTVFTTGKGASAVGLTAAVKRDPMSGEWTLEGGALVIADEGICLIDEFDKMSDKDRVSIHEAMEQQSISISKAGLVASLRARCSIIAAANPIFGRYDNSLTFSENVDLSDPMLSRFDVLAVIKDEVNPIQDEALADYVITSHMRSHPDVDPFRKAHLQGRDHNAKRRGPAIDTDGDDEENWIEGSGQIPHDMLKKYIFYARKNCHPEIRSTDESKLTEFYSQIRQAAIHSGGIPMTVRHLESVIRMAAANAKMRLSRFVEKRDFDFAVGTLLESFIQSQKYAVAMNLSRRFGRYRALASTPQDFIEALVIDVLNRKGREAFQRHAAISRRRNLNDSGAGDDEEMAFGASQNVGGAGGVRGEFDLNDVQHFADAELSWTELRTLAKHLYDIPDAALERYVQSDKFRARFGLRRDENDWIISQVRPEFDASSQGSQESQESQQ